MIASQNAFHRDQVIQGNGRELVPLGKAQRRRSDFHQTDPNRQGRTLAKRVDAGQTALDRPTHGESDMTAQRPDAASDDDALMLLTDRQWKMIQALPEVGRLHSVGRRPTDDREVLEAVLWVMRYQARWQDLPRDYPSPRTCQRRLRRWQDKGAWHAIWRTYLLSLDDESLNEWGQAFIDVALAEVDAAANGSARIGRPPFWFPMARDFWRITWNRQPDELKRQLWQHSDELFGEDADLTPPDTQ